MMIGTVEGAVQAQGGLPQVVVVVVVGQSAALEPLLLVEVEVEVEVAAVSSFFD